MLQQLYNIADTLIVGRFIGSEALAAVGSSYTLMTFLTSILLGLCMGSGAVFSIRYGEGDMEKLHESLGASFVLILAVAAVLNLAVFLLIDPIMYLLQVPGEIYDMMRQYLWVIFWGILATFLYNYFACLLRAVGNSVAPLIFLAVSSVMNIVLDLWFVLGFRWGVAGAAFATVLSQYASGIGLAVYTYWKTPEFRIQPRYLKPKPAMLKEIGQFSFPDLCPAVGDEPGDPDGPGAGEQFRHGDHGGFCGGGEDRFFRLYAGPGVWKCLFYICGSKLRSGKNREDPERDKDSGCTFRGILPGDLSSGIYLCRTSDDHFCGSC